MRGGKRDPLGKQERILAFIEKFVEERGYPPTVRDIQTGCGISSTSVVDYHLRRLERKSRLKRDRVVSRGIELVGHSRVVTVPILSPIAAGDPLPIPGEGATAEVEGQETLELPRDLLRGRENVYALRVKGTSMLDALIDDGDLVLMQPTAAADDGEMVAVWIESEQSVTLKRIYRESEMVRLQPANSQMEPLLRRSEDVTVQGRVIGVIRQLS